ncbi:unnamed protein product [Rhodiola kirilowii]
MRSTSTGVVRRRSLRLASKSTNTCAIDEEPDPVVATGNEESELLNDAHVPGPEEESEDLATGQEDVEKNTCQENEQSSSLNRKGKRKSEDVFIDLGESDTATLTLRSGKKVGKMSVSDSIDIAEPNSVNGKGKGKSVCENSPLSDACVQTVDDKKADEGGAGTSKRRFTREEKGKGLVDEHDLGTEANVAVKIEEGIEDDKSMDVPVSVQENIELDEDELVERMASQAATDAGRSIFNRFRDIARRNAVRFAHFNPETGEGNNNAPVEAGRPLMMGVTEAEDWPGPFSTAMKIIKDRANKTNVQQRTSAGLFSSKVEPLWVPKQALEPKRPKLLAPSLEDLSLKVLVKNADAISSLNSVPDALRHKLCQVLSDSRRMNGYFFKLLLSGSPIEVRIRDSSWLTEEDFVEHFAGCDTSNLMVLQLDQCGRCMPDYVLHATLARSTNSLPSLATLSLQAACRLSDSGLSALTAAAPRLQSINLSQCSLLTSTGIESLTKSLGPVLKELYIDDCQGIDVMQCLHCLKKVKCLEVLSVAGIESVCDTFIRELMFLNGQCLKELVLTNCMKLTDRSLKAIAENSTSLCALNLVNIPNMTDIGLGYLANGILEFKILKFCRNTFSDEALAAFVETCGYSLEELWLNNIIEVGRNTAVSLAKHSRKLVTLDVSWCRDLTDDALGLIVDSCDSLRILKIFGCTQLTDVFFDGHSNQNVQVIGRKMTPILMHLKAPNPLQGPLRYSPVVI